MASDTETVQCGNEGVSVTVPFGLKNLLQDFTIAILQQMPDDLIKFSYKYFRNKYELQQKEEKWTRCKSKKQGKSSETGEKAQSRGSKDEQQQEDETNSKSSKHRKSSECEENAKTYNSHNRDEHRQKENKTKFKKNDKSTDDEDNPGPSDSTFRRFASRRQSVSAENYNPEADDDEQWEMTTHPKTDDQRLRLLAAIQPILLFRSLNPEQIHDVVDAMFERKFSVGEHVITEGEDGDNFYVIDHGKFDIFVDGKKYGTYEDSGSFGELALMYNQPRAATIIATTEGAAWAMDRVAFRKIVLFSAYQRRKAYDKLLQGVPMLKTLTLYERMSVADALLSVNYKDGDTIIKQGDTPADCMYFVEKGTVRITIHPNANSPDVEVSTLHPGGYFGEIALLTHTPRKATVVADGPVRLAKLDVDAFERLLGPCMDIMQRNLTLYEDQVHKMFGSAAISASDLRPSMYHPKPSPKPASGSHH